MTQQQVNTAQTETQTVAGFRVAGVSCGLKGTDALDFALFLSDEPCVAAGIFTTNTVKAAPVLFDMENLANARNGYRAVVVNTRCANACTGETGLQNAREMATLAANALGYRADQVLVMSTGVIGTYLPMDKIARGVDLASNALGDDWDAAARAIMTTDTKPKFAQNAVTLPDGRQFHVAGVCKGAGMIAPNMATMLSVLVTDAALTPEDAQLALEMVAKQTYNRIVVDGDMSTNDTVLLLANGASGVALEAAAFADALQPVAKQLSQSVVRDGEGVTKFITLTVTGADDDATARQIANTIATSPLVKTAFYGGDANWGRMVAAAGRAGVAFAPEQATLQIAAGEDVEPQLTLFANGTAAHYDERAAATIMQSPAISVWLDCGIGQGQAVVYTCDLSHDYVSINGHYRS